jgi:asparagine synthase (glutamine-hydrolysing)
MNIVIINDAKFSWYSENNCDVKIYIKGSFWCDGNYFVGNSACKKLLDIFNAGNSTHSLPCKAKLKENIIKLRGHFSFIIDTKDFVLASVDKVQSYPIFFCNKDGNIYLANSAVKLQVEAGLDEKDEVSFLEFEMAGYVTGSNTLFKDLFQLQAGESLIFDKNKSSLKVIRFFRYFAKKIVFKNDEDLLDELHNITVKIFSDMVETLEGRPVWIPLSGGLDSRLVLAMLHKLKYDNITTFTYGIPGLWEIEHAKKIAECLKVKWHYIPYVPKKIKQLFHTTERKNYFRFASGLRSVPFLSDFYALWLMRETGVIPDNTVIINGQSGDYLTGGHIPERIREVDENKLTVDMLLKSIIDKHFSLWLNLKTEENLSIITKKILDSLQLRPDSKLSKNDFAQCHELHEWQERQTKYVVNGQRVYDWFGYDWRLPLWNDELILFWVKIDWRMKLNQGLFKKYLETYNYAGLFNIDIPEQTAFRPVHVKISGKLFSIAGRITTKDTEYFIRKYISYFTSGAPFYPQRNYFEYLKDSQWHRNSVSYLAKNLIESL